MGINISFSFDAGTEVNIDTDSQQDAEEIISEAENLGANEIHVTVE